MKLVKLLPECEDLPGEFAIYDLSDERNNASGKRYFLNRKYADYAMEHIPGEELIEAGIHEKEYVYGVGFYDTVKECELFYRCCCLELKLRNVRETMEQFQAQIGKMCSTIDDYLFYK